MDIQYELRGIRFRRNAEKAKRNIAKHGVSFEQGAEVFFDPFLRYAVASRKGEHRDAALGCDFEFFVLYVVHLMVEEGDHIRIISVRKADTSERKRYEDADN